MLLTGEPTLPVTDLLLAGARGFLRAEATPAELYKAIQTVVVGQYSVSRDALEHVVQHLRNQAQNAATGTTRDGSGLTPRERQVAAAVSRGESNREVAPQLGPRAPSRTT